MFYVCLVTGDKVSVGPCGAKIPLWIQRSFGSQGKAGKQLSAPAGPGGSGQPKADFSASLAAPETEKLGSGSAGLHRGRPPGEDTCVSHPGRGKHPS